LKIMPETTVCVRCASKLEEGIRRRQILISGQDEDSDSLFADEDDGVSGDSGQVEDEF